MQPLLYKALSVRPLANNPAGRPLFRGNGRRKQLAKRETYAYMAGLTPRAMCNAYVKASLARSLGRAHSLAASKGLLSVDLFSNCLKETSNRGQHPIASGYSPLGWSSKAVREMDGYKLAVNAILGIWKCTSYSAP